MAQIDKPVIVALICEANPRTETEEIDRAEWDAMTPAQRLELLDDMAATHMTNTGGYGWAIEDPDDEAAVGGSEPDRCRELAEWLASRSWMLSALRGLPNDGSATVLAEAIARARQALGRTEGAEG